MPARIEPTPRPRTLRGRGLAALAFLLALGVACDRVEIRRDGGGRDGGAGTAASADAPRAERPEGTSEDMRSIGPEGAMRVYYQFVDDRGQVRFVERLGDVPAAWRDQVGYVEMSQAPPLTPEEARRSWQVSEARATEILTAARTPDPTAGGPSGVVLYSADWCG